MECLGARVLASGAEDGSILTWRGVKSKRSGLRIWGCEETFQGHEGPVRVIALDRVDRLMASGGQDMTVNIWEITTGHLLNVLGGYNAPVNSVSFLASATFVVARSGSTKSGVKLTDEDWDMETTDGPGNIGYVNTVKIWNIESG